VNTLKLRIIIKKHRTQVQIHLQGIDVHQGVGSFKDKNTVTVTSDGGKTEEIKGKNIIIATGSKPASLPFINLDKERVITSTEALNLKEVPKHLVIIGGGVIGLALASLGVLVIGGALGIAAGGVIENPTYGIASSS
jgi:pyruvate/2-oxoglutarate dehydrogenase complex dihydrolipoamide dehydrogenase (E3) component